MPAGERLPTLSRREALAGADVEIVGRIPGASNAVFQGRLNSNDPLVDSTLCVYKPAAGERPLWDFPGAVLAKHEVAAYRVSEALGWGIVPPTVWREDLPSGPGVLQDWLDVEPSADIAVLGEGQVPDDWVPVLRGEDGHGRNVVVAHRGTDRLADVAVFDAIINNADRKAGHLLGTGEGTYGIDHGVAFHPEWKLRTVLWGFAGTPLAARHLDGLTRLQGVLGRGEMDLDGLDGAAAEAMQSRIQDLLDTGVFPQPRPGWPVVPWPLW